MEAVRSEQAQVDRGVLLLVAVVGELHGDPACSRRAPRTAACGRSGCPHRPACRAARGRAASPAARALGGARGPWRGAQERAAQAGQQANQSMQTPAHGCVPAAAAGQAERAPRIAARDRAARQLHAIVAEARIGPQVIGGDVLRAAGEGGLAAARVVAPRLDGVRVGARAHHVAGGDVARDARGFTLRIVEGEVGRRRRGLVGVDEHHPALPACAVRRDSSATLGGSSSSTKNSLPRAAPRVGQCPARTAARRVG